MIYRLIFLGFLLLARGIATSAQEVPTWEVSAHAGALRSNLVGSDGCCFWMYGGSGSFAWSQTNWFSVVVEGSAYKASQVERTAKDLNLFTYLAGPRVAYRKRNNFTLFGQGLFGASQVRGTLIPRDGSNSSQGIATAFGFSVGGGLDLDLKPTLSVRLLEAEYLYTGFQNGSNARQSSLKVSAGIVFRFGRN